MNPSVRSAIRWHAHRSGKRLLQRRRAIELRVASAITENLGGSLETATIADGAMIVRRALESPLRQIAINAGQDGAVVVQNVRAAGKKNWGYNAATDTHEDLVASGVIDPTD
jgi:chaperonin GroEL